jgi:hypothetical protein
MTHHANHTIHNYPAAEFEALGVKYPTGEYDQHASGSTLWFRVTVPEMNLQLVWFKGEK